MHIEEKFVLEYIRENLEKLFSSTYEVENAKFHHNTSYEEAASVAKWGIMSLDGLNKLGIKKFSSDFLKTMKDTDSHVNGTDGVSLAVVGLTDLYPDECEYDPFCVTQVDFLINSNIKAFRSSINYGNEYISRDMINPEDIKTIDIRFLEYIEKLEEDKSSYLKKHLIESVVGKYNCLSDVASVLEKNRMNIPIREMSFNQNNVLDVKKLIKIPKLTLKR